MRCGRKRPWTSLRPAAKRRARPSANNTDALHARTSTAERASIRKSSAARSCTRSSRPPRQRTEPWSPTRAGLRVCERLSVMRRRGGVAQDQLEVELLPGNGLRPAAPARRMRRSSKVSVRCGSTCRRCSRTPSGRSWRCSSAGCSGAAQMPPAPLPHCSWARPAASRCSSPMSSFAGCICTFCTLLRYCC